MSVVDRISSLQGEELPVQGKLARGYRNKAFVGYYIFPYGYVAKEEGKIPNWGKGAFKEYNTKRGLREDSNRIVPDDQDYIEYKTEEHDLEFPRDYREDKAAVYNLRKYATYRSMQGIQLKQEIIQSRIAQDTDTYEDTNKVTLTGTDQWSDFENSDPLGDIEDGKQAIRDQVNEEPNTAVIAEDTYHETLRRHPALTALLGDNETKIISVEKLKEILEIKNIYIGKSKYTQDGETFEGLWSGTFWMGYVPEKQGSEDFDPEAEPSFGYTIRVDGHPFTFEYSNASGKVMYVNTTDNYQVKVVGAESGYLIDGTV